MGDQPSGIDSQNAPHNLDAETDTDEDAPERDVREADFAAEAHGFTGYEKAGRGSDYDGSARERVTDSSGARSDKVVDAVLKREAIEEGPLGELQLIQGERTGLRLWSDYTTDGKQDRERPYEIVGYVIAGEVTAVIDGIAHALVKGDSFVVPAGTPHRFRIDAPATVLEATSPPAADCLD